MAQLTLGEAAKAAGKSKSTVLRSIKAGRISAVRDELTGGWLIEPAELHRVYPAQRDAANDTLRNGHDTAELRARLADAHETIRDLRGRLDAETEERRRLTAVLADQRVSPTVGESPARRRWWRFGR